MPLSLSFCAMRYHFICRNEKNTTNKRNDGFKRTAQRERLKWSKQRLPLILRSFTQKEERLPGWNALFRLVEHRMVSRIFFIEPIMCGFGLLFLHFKGFYRSEVDANLLIIRPHNGFHSLFDTILGWAK